MNAPRRSFPPRRFCAGAALLLLCALAPAPTAAEESLPPVVAVLRASRRYPLATVAQTSHAGWSEATAEVNFPQEARLRWHVDPGGEAVLLGRPAWEPSAPWRRLGTWPPREAGARERGERTLRFDVPMRLRLRVRGPRFPRSGVACLCLRYERQTVALLRGGESTPRRPVLLAEGYDPFNEQDWNEEPAGEASLVARTIAEGWRRYGVQTWVLDWGDGGAPLEQQAEDAAAILRQIRQWSGGGRKTVAVGVSMGAVSLRYALARAAEAGEELGVRKYISINGPHRGAWVAPELRRFLLARLGRRESDDPMEDPDGFRLRRGLDSPAARQLLIGEPEHEAFYARLRALGESGYPPGLPRVAFSNGTLVREGGDLADFGAEAGEVVHRISLRPLWLPLWLTVRATRRQFRFGAYPGELLPESLRRSMREHRRILGIFRLDFRAEWEAAPTFIPTHSALDFPETLAGGPRRYRYVEWRRSAFPVIYVSRARNFPHDEPQTDWIDPRTGRGAPGGENAVLYEVRRPAQPEAPRRAAPAPAGAAPEGAARRAAEALIAPEPSERAAAPAGAAPPPPAAR